MSEHIEIDDLDKKILSMISKDARIPYLEVARACRVSGAAIHQRIHRLSDLGIITGSEFTIDPQKIGYSTCAFIGIFLEKASLYHEAIKKIEEIPEVVESHFTTGDYSIFIKIYAKNNDHLRNILYDVQAIQGILRTETFISLEQNFKRQLPIE